MFANGHRLARSVFALVAAILFAVFGGGGADEVAIANAATVPAKVSQVIAADQRRPIKPGNKNGLDSAPAAIEPAEPAEAASPMVAPDAGTTVRPRWWRRVAS